MKDLPFADFYIYFARACPLNFEAKNFQLIVKRTDNLGRIDCKESFLLFNQLLLNIDKSRKSSTIQNLLLQMEKGCYVYRVIGQ